MQAGAAAPACKEPPSPSRLTLKNELDLELGEGRVRAGEMLNFEKFGCNRLTNVFQHPHIR